jgi:hypothetical protein
VRVQGSGFTVQGRGLEGRVLGSWLSAMGFEFIVEVSDFTYEY